MKNEEKVDTTTEETKTSVDSASAGTDVEVSTEKSVEQSSEVKSEDSKPDDAQRETNVNVKVENNIPSVASTAPTHDANKNYEAAQPVVDPVI